MAGPVNMENLFLSLKGKFENLYLPGVDNIKSVSLVPFLENELTLVKGTLKGNSLYFFQLGL